MTCRETKPLLGGYLDGELDLVHSLQLEEHLAQCASCSADLKLLEETSGAVAALPRYRATRRLGANAGARLSRRAPVWIAAAAGLVLVLLAAWRWVPLRPDREGPLEKEIVQNHIRSLLASHLLDLPASDWRTVQPWFRGKLDYAPVVEDISAQGFSLAGGRLDYLAGRTVAALVYERGAHVINVFVWPAAGERDQSPALHVLAGYNVVGWRANGMNWWAVSDLDSVALGQLPLCPCFMPPKSTLHALAADGSKRDRS